MNYRIPMPDFSVWPPKVYQCRRAQMPFVLDGNLEKPFWENARWTEDFQDIQGGKFPAPRCRTRMKMLWDDNAVYFGAELMGAEIWSNVTRRDHVIFQDNDIEIFIDPDGDSHCYCEFEMNARNTVWDLLLTKPYRDGGFPINSFDIKGLQTAVQIDGELNNPDAKNKKWSVEVVIPHQSLMECCNSGAAAPACGSYWRIDFSRVQWPVDPENGRYVKRCDPVTGKPLPEDNWVWSPTGIINMHYPELWGFLFFCEDEETVYEIPAIEQKKWELRKLYYRLHKAYDENGSFSLPQKEIPSGIALECTSKSFLLSYPCKEAGQILTMREDGNVKAEKEKE